MWTAELTEPCGAVLCCLDVYTLFFPQHYCNYFDAHLSSVSSKEEYAFVTDLVYKALGSNKSAWLGGTASTKVRLLHNDISSGLFPGVEYLKTIFSS